MFDSGVVFFQNVRVTYIDMRGIIQSGCKVWERDGKYHVDCCCRELTKIPVLPKLASSVDLSKNNITDLRSGTPFAGMTVLTDLDLSDNPLQYISTQIFDGLSNLTTLFIRKSFLYKQRYLVLDSLFSDLKSLQRLAFTFLYFHPWPLYLLPDCSKVHKSQPFGKVDSLQKVKILEIDSALLKWKRNDTLKSSSFQCEKLYLVNGEFCFYSHLTQEQFEYRGICHTLERLLLHIHFAKAK